MNTFLTNLPPLPLFPSEDEIARAVLGEKHAKHWPLIAVELERQGFPRIEPLYRGRCWPKCVLWFASEFGLDLFAGSGAKSEIPGAGRVRVVPYVADSKEGSGARKAATIHPQRATPDNRRTRPEASPARRSF